MSGLYLITGGNLGDRALYLKEAMQLLESRIGSVIRSSALYETAAWGDTVQAAYLNQVLHFETSMPPEKILRICLDTEQELGRIREGRWAARTIDIDMLFYNDYQLDQPGLHIPHPRIAQRRFVLVPMNELAPDLLHPVLQKTISDLLVACEDPLDVRRYDASAYTDG